MLKIENAEVTGWDHAIRGMRNPMNSWEKSDTVHRGCLGHNDHQLMMSLAKGGPVHAKYRRMITVYLDITAPLYWFKEFDTYKIGTVANSCSTMHKIHAKEFELSDFSIEHLMCLNDDRGLFVDMSVFRDESSVYSPIGYFDRLVELLNKCRLRYLETKDKKYWWQMIQLLPSSYNQRRTVMLNYEVLAGIYESRKNHKLDEWRDFCKWIEILPYSELITGERHETDSE